MGREVRRVPPDWQHPKDEAGQHIPLMGGSFSERLAKWEEGNRQWAAGYREDFATDGGWIPRTPDEDMNFEDWDGRRPVASDFMPDWTAEQATHFQMYEDTSEGTPISPVCGSPEELARWLVDNRASAFAGQTASYESWLRVCQGGWAPSAVIYNGIMVNGVDGITK